MNKLGKNTYYSFAMRDYNMMRMAVNNGSDDYDSIVILCQQFLEKYLKQLLEIGQGKSLKVHKLTVLSHNLGLHELDKYEDFFRRVQDYYFDKRCPSDYYIETTKDECEYVVKTTEELKTLLDEILDNTYKNDKMLQLNVFSKFDKE